MIKKTVSEFGGSEYAIVDIGPKGNECMLYIQRTYKTKQDANFVRAELLEGFPETNLWHKRLAVIEHPAIPLRKKT